MSWEGGDNEEAEKESNRCLASVVEGEGAKKEEVYI